MQPFSLRTSAEFVGRCSDRIDKMNVIDIVLRYSPEELDQIWKFDANHNTVKMRKLAQATLDLMYILDHRDVSLQIMQSPELRKQFWRAWLNLLKPMSLMNSYHRRNVLQEHVQYQNEAYGPTLMLQIDLSNHIMLFYFTTMLNPLVCMTHPPVAESEREREDFVNRGVGGDMSLDTLQEHVDCV